MDELEVGTVWVSTTDEEELAVEEEEEDCWEEEEAAAEEEDEAVEEEDEAAEWTRETERRRSVTKIWISCKYFMLIIIILIEK